MPNVSGTRYGPSCPAEDMDSVCPLPSVPKPGGSRQGTPKPEEDSTDLQNLKGNGNVAFAVSLAMTNPRSNCSLICHVIVLYHISLVPLPSPFICIVDVYVHLHATYMYLLLTWILYLYSFAAYATFRLNLFLVFCRTLSLDSSPMYFFGDVHHPRLSSPPTG